MPPPEGQKKPCREALGTDCSLTGWRGHTLGTLVHLGTTCHPKLIRNEVFELPTWLLSAAETGQCIQKRVAGGQGRGCCTGRGTERIFIDCVTRTSARVLVQCPSRRFKVPSPSLCPACATSSGFRRAMKDLLRRHHSQAATGHSISVFVSRQIQ